MIRTLKYRFPQKEKKRIKGRINYEFIKALKKQNIINFNLEIEFRGDCLQRHL